MNEWMIRGACVAAGILIMAVWHGLHVYWEGRGLRPHIHHTLHTHTPLTYTTHSIHTHTHPYTPSHTTIDIYTSHIPLTYTTHSIHTHTPHTHTHTHTHSHKHLTIAPPSLPYLGLLGFKLWSVHSSSGRKKGEGKKGC